MAATSLPPRAASCVRSGRNSICSRATYTAVPPPCEKPIAAIRSGFTSGRVGQQRRCHEHVAGGHGVACAHLALAARRKAVELEGRIALLLQKEDSDRQRAASDVGVIA